MKKLVSLLAAASIITGGAMAAEKPKAIFHTSEGDFTCELFPDKSPKTVANFVGLAKGTKAWTDPSGQVVKDKPLYSNTKFHRTIPNFMIQGGDPAGNGTGGPGYNFEDEFSDLTFDGPGYLAMANRGPATNGSQFFVTVAPTPHLTNKHTIFGKLVSGKEVVDKIVNKPNNGGIAISPVILKSVEIVEAGAAAGASDSATTGSDKGTTGSATK